MTFTPDAGAEPTTATTDNIVGLSVFTLVPPGEGPQVYEIGFDLSVEQRTVSIEGSATIEVDAGEPWAGLVPRDTSIGATFEEKTGEWVLVATDR